MSKGTLTIADLRRAVEALKAQRLPEASPEHPFMFIYGGRLYKNEGRGTFDAGPIPQLPLMADDVEIFRPGAGIRAHETHRKG